MKKPNLIILLLIILFNSCDSAENIELNCISSLTYKWRNGKVDSTMVDHIKADWSRNFKIEFFPKNDTLFAYGYDLSDLNENNRNNRLPPYLTSTIHMNSELNCSKKIIIHQNEIKYSFCYSDVIDYLDKQIEKSEKDVYYLIYLEIKENLLNQISEKESIFYCDYIIYDFLLNLPFNAYDKYKEIVVPKIVLSDYFSGWSGGSEYFLLNKRNDTIAYHGFQRWVN
jgi:hypothetical protein